MAEKLTQQDFKDFAKAYNEVQRQNREERIDAVGLLTPSLLRKHLKSGKDLVLAYGRQGETVRFTLHDLKQFADNIEKTKKSNRRNLAGVPLIQLERTSWVADKLRAKQIRNATLYKIVNNVLHFQVTSSGERGGPQHYRVTVRLEEWYDQITDPRSWFIAARDAAVGRLSFDCGCGRHQYWFRYLATIGNFALTPKEKDFPKIRNPELKGCCCKHVLKVLQQLKSASIQKMLAVEMERQSESVGYVDKGNSRFLTSKELGKAKRAKGSAKETRAAKKAYRDFKEARDVFKKKISDKKMKAKIKELQSKLMAKQAKEKALKAKIEAQRKQAERDLLATRLQGHLDASEIYDVPRDVAVKKFAEKNNMSASDVNKLIGEYKL